MKLNVEALSASLTARARALRMFVSSEWPLIAGLIVYVSLCVIFVIFGQRSWILKFVATLVGVGLAAAIPELASKDRMWLRVVLIVAAALGIAGMQLLSDRKADEDRRSELHVLVATKQASDARDDIKEREAKRRDTFLPSPGATVRAVSNVRSKFLLKARRLSLRVAVDEGRLLRAAPELTDTIAALPADVAARRESYTRLKTAESLAAVAANIDAVIRALEREEAYERAADALKQNEALYLRVANNLDQMDEAEICGALKLLASRLSPVADRYPSGGLDNYIGNLAMSCKRFEDALAWMYRGYAEEPEHVPVYESLAFTLWSGNRDTFNAADYASRGLVMIQTETAAVAAELDAAQRAYADAAQRRPQSANALRGRMAALKRQFDVVNPEYTAFLRGFTERLMLDDAYFSALGFVNEERARAEVTKLLQIDSKDPDFLDAKGFVLMRFFKSPDERVEAGRLFREAAGSHRADDNTKALAQEHFKELSGK